MPASTNSLVAKTKRLAAPVGAVIVLLIAVVFVCDHTRALAASGGGVVAATPMDDSSVSSLVALDNAVEAVAARVTPAVVNVSVTSHANAGQPTTMGRARVSAGLDSARVPVVLWTGRRAAAGRANDEAAGAGGARNWKRDYCFA